MPSCGCGGTLNGPQHHWKVIRSQQLCGTPAAMTHHDSEEISQSQPSNLLKVERKFCTVNYETLFYMTVPALVRYFLQIAAFTLLQMSQLFYLKGASDISEVRYLHRAQRY